MACSSLENGGGTLKTPHYQEGRHYPWLSCLGGWRLDGAFSPIINGPGWADQQGRYPGPVEVVSLHPLPSSGWAAPPSHRVWEEAEGAGPGMMEPPSSGCLRCFLAESRANQPLERGAEPGRPRCPIQLLPRNGRKLGMAFPGSNLFYYYSLGRHFFVTAQLSNHWFRVRDRVTGEWMLMKKVPVVSDWQKMLHHFLFLPPGPGLLVPYVVLYDRQGSLLYLMEDPGVLTVGWPPAAQQLDRLKCLLEVLRFLQFCQHQGLQLEEVNSALLHTHQGIRFDPSGLSSNEGPYVFRKTLRNALQLVWNTPQEDTPATEALLERMWRWLEEDLGDREEHLDEARMSSLNVCTL
ncbi:uncharacterized protein LOC123234238 [Gracilinanus agilis]|uniref:uncharacterized protein LOC123234238 n=1 Tax=Gracilinanus agilis TaxID=191870 RepID=UPI001CFD53F8|nr:uncharacterized protein LOC123234238 [Gracilinanus agilis]